MELEMSRDQEQMASKDASSTHIAKGKRTKRLRLLSSSSPSGVAAGGMTSSCSTDYYNSSEEEEEDMANCLILLAQGGGDDDDDDDDGKKTEKGMSSVVSNRKFGDTRSTASNLYIYECKTCNRTFSSFQALGGHRASHKKPKLIIPEHKKKPSPPPSEPEFEEAREPRGHTISLQRGGATNNSKAKIHECSICGSEFTSGQALGGHMRRHRATANIATATTSIIVDDPPRNILGLDLNLPAPEESIFQYPATQKSMVLSVTPALVDCHY